MGAASVSGKIYADRFQITGLLGRGGMGAVFEGRDLDTDRTVAVKVILQPDEEATERLLREARAVSKIIHPNVVMIDEVGVDNSGHPYLVMERLYGSPLNRVIREAGRLAPPIAAAILEPIAHALAAAHAQGIVHRDLKPANIFMARSKDGSIVPKVLDFGVAKLIGAQSVSMATLTATGQVMGTPAYMSPEQVEGSRDIGPPTDIWALGAVGYHMITGEKPFTGDSMAAILMGVLSKEPDPPSSRGIEIDPALEALLMRCLYKKVSARYDNATQIAESLAAYAKPLPSADQLLPAEAVVAPVDPSDAVMTAFSDTQFGATLRTSDSAMRPSRGVGLSAALFGGAVVLVAVAAYLLSLRPLRSEPPKSAAAPALVAPTSTSVAPKAAVVEAPEPPPTPAAIEPAPAPAQTADVAKPEPSAEVAKPDPKRKAGRKRAKGKVREDGLFTDL